MKRNTSTQRLLSLALVLALFIALLPAIAMPTLAVESAESLFSRLGFDTSATPQENERRSQMNPYGSATTQIVTVNEVFAYGQNEGNFKAAFWAITPTP